MRMRSSQSASVPRGAKWWVSELIPVRFMLRSKFIIAAIAALFTGACATTGDRSQQAAVTRVDMLTYHFDRQRSGWNPHETTLTPESVAARGLELLWQSPQLDGHNGEAPVLFASPLYVDDAELAVAPFTGLRTAIVITATSTGYVYAINARDSNGIALGQILWSHRLADEPCRDGRMSILSTPVVDPGKGLVYVTSCDTSLLYRAFAFDLGSGRLADGWPVAMNPETVNAPGINRNPPNEFPAKALMYQRGALNLSHDGSRLYVP